MIYYDKLPRWPKGARPAWTYRGARRRIDRQNRRCDQLKAERKALGITRSEHDQRRNLWRWYTDDMKLRAS